MNRSLAYLAVPCIITILVFLAAPGCPFAGEASRRSDTLPTAGQEIPDWMARWELARVLSYAGRHEESVTEYRKLLKERPDLPKARIELAKVLFWQKKAGEALAVLEGVCQGPQIIVGSSMGGWLATLAALAHRALRRSLGPEQRAAMVALALAVERGTVARGAAAVAAARSTGEPGSVLVVETGARAAGPAGDDGNDEAVDRLRRLGVTVVVVPDGLLAAHDRIALAPAPASAEPVAHLHAVP